MGREYKEPSRCDLTLIRTTGKNVTEHYYLINIDKSNDYSSWYPASTVKFVAAALAAKRLTELGFENPGETTITFHYAEGAQVRTWSALLDLALKVSDNIAYNELVILAGHSIMSNFLIAHNYDIALNKPYLKSKWKARTGLNPATLETDKHTFAGCRITVNDGVKSVEIAAARANSYRLDTSRSSSCSTKGLADFLNDLIFKNDSILLINESFYNSLINKMKERKSEGQENFVDAILSKIRNREEWDVIHKPGFITTISESDGNDYTYWCDTVCLKNKDPDKSSYTFCAYGGEDKKVLSDLGKNTKIEKQNMLNSKYYDETHMGMSEALAKFINKEG